VDIAIGPMEGTREIVWAVGNSGLRCIRSKEDFFRIPGPARGFPSGPKSLAVDSTGRVWLGTPQYLMSFDGANWREERNTGLMDLMFDKAGRLWGQGDSAFHWMEAGAWREHPFGSMLSKSSNTVNALVQGPGDAIAFHQQLCSFACASYIAYKPQVRIGILTPDSLRNLFRASPGGPPTAIAYDDQGGLWLGSGSGLDIIPQIGLRA
jgi:ligand-binding sensor domain-containing protein